MIKKRMWQKPKFLILTRHKPEEAVLVNCKGNNVITHQNNKYNGCYQTLQAQVCTKDCPTVMPS